MRYIVILISILIFPVLGFSATIIVPDDYPTIQGAIDASVNGDTVLVEPGTYVENVDFKGKAITVNSEQGPDVTIIDGGNPSNPDFGSVVAVYNNENNNSILDGFTITNGTGTYDPAHDAFLGGGIFCSSSSPTITSNIISSSISNKKGFSSL